MTVEPATMCPTCNRRVPKPKQPTSPDTKVVSIGRLPVERQEALADALDALCEYTGATKHSYPKGVILEALVGLGAAHREELRDYLDNRDVL